MLLCLHDVLSCYFLPWIQAVSLSGCLPDGHLRFLCFAPRFPRYPTLQRTKASVCQARILSTDLLPYRYVTRPTSSGVLFPRQKQYTLSNPINSLCSQSLPVDFFHSSGYLLIYILLSSPSVHFFAFSALLYNFSTLLLYFKCAILYYISILCLSILLTTFWFFISRYFDYQNILTISALIYYLFLTLSILFVGELNGVPIIVDSHLSLQKNMRQMH